MRAPASGSLASGFQGVAGSSVPWLQGQQSEVGILLPSKHLFTSTGSGMRSIELMREDRMPERTRKTRKRRQRKSGCGVLVRVSMHGKICNKERKGAKSTDG